MERGGATNIGLDVCVRVFDQQDTDYNWFLINSNTPETGIVYPVLSMSLADYYSSSVASYGSKVYISGGLDLETEEASKAVYCMDTRCPEKEWERLPSMHCGRADHGSIFVDDKLYVWGAGSEVVTTYAEVYDTKREKWDLLDDLPFDVRLRGVESTWKTYISEMILGSDYKSACVGGIIYSICRSDVNELLAFDPSAPSEPKSVVSAKSEVDLFDFLPYYDMCEDDTAPSHYLLSLGEDILGVLYLENPAPLEPDLEEYFIELSCLHCSKFRMKHEKGEEKFTAELIYHSRHFILGRDIDKCVAVEPLWARDKVLTASCISPEHVNMKKCKSLHRDEGLFDSSSACA